MYLKENGGGRGANDFVTEEKTYQCGNSLFKKKIGKNSLPPSWKEQH